MQPTRATQPTATTTAPTPTTTPPTATTTAPTSEHGGDVEALARCVGDVDAFLADTFTVAPHRWRGGSFDDLLSLADIDAQLTGAGLRRPAIRLVRDGEVLDPAMWTRRARTGSVWVDDLVHPGRALALFGEGATLVLQSLQRWWPPLTSFCRQLEAAVGHPVQANAYLTPGGAAGLTPHHDTHDVFVLQVHGHKHWAVRQPLVEAPLRRHRSSHGEAASQPVLFEADLAPGDCLYLPRGYIHSADTQAGASLHLTLGVLATTVHDVLRHLIDQAAEVPSFRRSLQLGYGDDTDSARRVVKGVAAELIGWLAHLGEADVEDVAGVITRRAQRRSPSLDGQLHELVALDGIDDSTTVARRADLHWELREEGERARLALDDRTLDLPLAAATALRRLLDGSSHRVGDLGDLLDERSRLVLVRRLIREGALRQQHGA